MPEENTQKPPITNAYTCNSVPASVTPDVARSQLSKVLPQYSNLTPWALKLFFVHTYYAYTFVFYMFLIMFYKSYALQYPQRRSQMDMMIIMTVPIVQHAFFYFGHYGCEHGAPRDLGLFLFMTTVLLWMLMYFLFEQAYIMPIESKLCCFHAILITIEGACGVVNILQTITRPAKANCMYLMGVLLLTGMFIVTVLFLICYEFRPNTMLEIQSIETGPSVGSKVVFIRGDSAHGSRGH